MKDCLARGEAPFASHLLYTQCLDDTNPEERRLGMEAGFVWRTPETKTVVYLDYGTSGGMARGIHNAHKKGSLVELRKIGKNPGDES